MANRDKIRRVLRFETVGFLLLGALSWLDELVSLPHLLFGSQRGFNWQEAMMETAALFAVWLAVYACTKRLMCGEGSVKVCIWCRKISDGPSWLATEEYFCNSFRVAASYGACPDCRKKWERYLEPPATDLSAETGSACK